MAVDYGALARQGGGADLDSLAASMGGAPAEPGSVPASAPYSGLPDQPLEENLLNQIQGGLELGTTLAGGYGLARGAFGAGGRVLGSLGERYGPAVGKYLLEEAGGPLGRFGRMLMRIGEAGKRAAPIAEAAAPVAEAAAPAAEAGTAASRAALSAADQAALKAASDTLRRRAFATLGQLGEKTDAEALGKIVGRTIKSRTELTASEWNQIVNHADDLLAQKLANERVAAKLAKGAAKRTPKVVPEAPAEPRVAPKPRGAAPRGHSTTGPAVVPSGQLGSELQASLALEREMAARGITDPADKAVIYAQARRLGLVP